MVDIPEQIFQSIDLLVDNKINKLSFDRTEEAVVTDASRASEGIYTVSSGTVSYIAYSESRNYRNNDHVYVAIMNNDFTQQKVIISRVFDEVTGNYRDPLKGLIEVQRI